MRAGNPLDPLSSALISELFYQVIYRISLKTVNVTGITTYQLNNTVQPLACVTDYSCNTVCEN